MLISEYQRTLNVNKDDYLILDGDTQGTKRINTMSLLANATGSPTESNGYAEIAKRTFRNPNSNLGNVFTKEQAETIKDGIFRNMNIGSSWGDPNLDNLRWIIVDLNYYYANNVTNHNPINKYHIMIMPSRPIEIKAVDCVTTVDTGTIISDPVKSVGIQTELSKGLSAAKNFFGSDHIMPITRRVITATDFKGIATAIAWEDLEVDLPSIGMIYGVIGSSENINNVMGNNNRQLAFFKNQYYISGNFMGSYRCWLSTVTPSNIGTLPRVAVANPFWSLEFWHAMNDNACFVYPILAIC